MFKHSKNKSKISKLSKLSTISKTKHKLKKKNKYSKRKSFVKYSKKYNLNGGAGKNPRTNENPFRDLINELLVKMATIGKFIKITQFTELLETIENMTDMNKEIILFSKLHELNEILPDSMYEKNNNNEIKHIKKESLMLYLNKIIPDIISDIEIILNARKNNAIRPKPKVMDNTIPFYTPPAKSTTSSKLTPLLRKLPPNPVKNTASTTPTPSTPSRSMPPPTLTTTALSASTQIAKRRLPLNPVINPSPTKPTASAKPAASATFASPATTPFVDFVVLPIIFSPKYSNHTHDNFTNSSLLNLNLTNNEKQQLKATSTNNSISFLKNNERKRFNDFSKNKTKIYNDLGRNIIVADASNNYTPLYNVDNSCYLNSVLQMLFSIPDVKDFIKNNDLPVNNGIINSMKILVEYFYDGREGHNGREYKAGQILNIDDKPRIPELPVLPTIYDQIYNKYSHSDPYTVNDVFEYINYLFNAITGLDNIMNFTSTELRTCKNHRAYYEENLSENILSIPISNKEYQDEFITYRRRLKSIYTTPTSNEIKQITNPEEANKQTQNLHGRDTLIQDELINFLQNPLQNQRPRKYQKYLQNQQEQQITLQDCINKSFAAEIYDLEQDARSVKCGKDLNGSGLPLEKHQIKSYTTKKFIILAINRFFNLYGDATGYKIFWEITPNPIIRIRNEGEIEKIYKLKSCIIHVGNYLSTGHYIYLNFNENGTAKDIIDDDTIYKYNGEVEPIHNYLRNGYVYLYEEIEVI